VVLKEEREKEDERKKHISISSAIATMRQERNTEHQ
jgi:hypothetical protein